MYLFRLRLACAEAELGAVVVEGFYAEDYEKTKSSEDVSVRRMKLRGKRGRKRTTVDCGDSADEDGWKITTARASRRSPRGSQCPRRCCRGGLGRCILRGRRVQD
jgi:hypothetical protein